MGAPTFAVARVARRARAETAVGINPSYTLVGPIGQVRHQVFDHRHVRQGVNLHVTLGVINRSCSCKRITAVNIHRTRSANTLAAGTTKRQGRVYLILDLDQRVEDHRAAAVHIDFIRVDAWIFDAVRVISIYGEQTCIRRTLGRGKMFAFANSRIWRQPEFSQVLTP